MNLLLIGLAFIVFGIWCFKKDKQQMLKGHDVVKYDPPVTTPVTTPPKPKKVNPIDQAVFHIQLKEAKALAIAEAMGLGPNEVIHGRTIKEHSKQYAKDQIRDLYKHPDSA